MHLTESEIIKIAETSINKIKSGTNPYKNLQFVDKIFESCEPQIIESVKKLLKGNFEGSLNENLFVGEQLSAAQHLYNYLYEHNLLSKYPMIAEYMNYPSINKLKKKVNEEQEQFEDEGQQWQSFMEYICERMKKNEIKGSIATMKGKGLELKDQKRIGDHAMFTFVDKENLEAIVIITISDFQIKSVTFSYGGITVKK